MKKVNVKNSIFDISVIALFTALTAVCAWISIPSAIPFTLQTFGIFAALGILGGKRGTVSVCIYVLLGLVGAPVFSGFKGGAGVLFGTTGGYITGFIFSALVYWLITLKHSDNPIRIVSGYAAGLAVCYLIGTLWFVFVYSAKSEPVSFLTALSVCVFPFIIPDVIKTALAFGLVRILRPLFKKYDYHMN